MTKEFITPHYGIIIVSNAMFEDKNGTDLYEGIELKDVEDNIIEIPGYWDIDEMTNEEVEDLLESYI